jgi:YD repeat-containing protein
VYTFSGAVNDVVVIRAGNLTGGNFTPNIELYNPAGGLVASNYNELDRTLTVAGTYTILMREYSNGSAGNFTLTWQKMNGPCNGSPANCGQVVSGSITGTGQMVAYTFAGTANDGITIRAMKTSGNLSPYIELYGPAGTQVASPMSEINTILSASGTYTIFLRDQFYTGTGNSLLLWQKMNNPCNATLINCGQVGTGSIGTAADSPPWRFHTFTASAGDAVTIRAAADPLGGALNPYAELYGPNGSRITLGPLFDVTLTQTGNYALLIRGGPSPASGNYAVTWRKMNNPCNATPIGCGQVVKGSVTTVGETKAYTFTASANDRVTIRIRKIAGNISPNIELYGPTGSQLVPPNNLINTVLTTSGQYTILVRDQFQYSSGDYLLMWQRLNSPCSTKALQCGQLVKGEIGVSVDKPAWRVYTFTASANDAVTIQTTNATVGPFAPIAELFGPSGTGITSGSSISATLGAGTHTVLVRDSNLFEDNRFIGVYSLKLQKNGNSCPEINLATPNGGDIVDEGDNYSISWTSSSISGITSQEIRLSADGGVTFPTVVATGLPAATQSFDWSVPVGSATQSARIRVTVTDTSGRTSFDDSDSNFIISQGVKRVYVYDELGRLIQITYEDGSKVNYTYDAAGNRITLTNEP